MICLFIFSCVILYYITLIIIFKVKSKFWYIQPCYHFYDLHYVFYKNQVIQRDLPKINSFVSFEKVNTYSPDDIHEKSFNHIVELLRNEYYHTKNASYNPTIQSILPYLSKNFHNSYISLAIKPTYTPSSDNNNIIKYNDIIGCIMSKSICITTYSHEFYSYYVDFFCIKREYRKLGYSEIMIQSHEYSNRIKTKEIQTHLFKREGVLTGIVPVVTYNTHLYNLPDIINHYSTPSNFLYNIKDTINTPSPILIQITKSNAYLLVDYLKSIKEMNCFPFVATSNISNIIELIETKNIFCFVLFYRQDIYASYFLKNTYMEIEAKQCLSCFASIKDKSYDTYITEYTFYQTFLQILHIMGKFSFLFIENISHNHLLIKEIGDCISTSKTAYFLYNYIFQPVKPKEVFIFI